MKLQCFNYYKEKNQQPSTVSVFLPTYVSPLPSWHFFCHAVINIFSPPVFLMIYLVDLHHLKYFLIIVIFSFRSPGDPDV